MDAIASYKTHIQTPYASGGIHHDPGLVLEQTATRILRVKDSSHMAPAVAQILRAAVDQELVDGGRLYPPNVVEVALLSYAWKVADRVEELYDAFWGGLLTEPALMWTFRTPRP